MMRRLLITMTMVAAIFVSISADSSFVKSYQGCAPGQSGSNCPQMWHVANGPGWVGQRATWEDGRGVRIICTPSCASLSNSRECSLIMAFHGIYNNPLDQEYLMIGHNGNGGAYDESLSAGGPYCISFHKSAGYGWQYNCKDSDHLHLSSFIDYALTQWPINADRVNVHGYSSGGIQIHNMMKQFCDIESKIAVASTYGSGNVPAPPTTRAAYLLVHGTQDTIVTYQNLWVDDPRDPSLGKTQVKSCCAGVCDPNGMNLYYELFAEGLAAAIATNRGYSGDVIGGTHPSPSRTLHLVDDYVEYCESRKSKCISHYVSPNPWNSRFTCPAPPGSDTDVLEYPVSSDRDGKVEVWRINTWNHGYPNRRMASSGVTNFFLELRKFFYANKGRKTYSGVRSVVDLQSGVLCNGSAEAIGVPFTDQNWSIEVTKDQCREMCLNDYLCEDAFYMDLRPLGYWTNCQIWYKTAPCDNIQSVTWANSQHFKGYTTLVPTDQPKITNNPSMSPTKTSVPSAAPIEESLCYPPKVLNPSLVVSYACLVNGDSIGDFLGEYTEVQCSSNGGIWTSYDCQIAENYWLTLDGWLKDYIYDWYYPVCCTELSSTPSLAPTLSVSPTITPTSTPTSAPTLSASPTIANIAFGKPTTQSSTQSGGVSSRAVDGNTNGRWKQNSVTSTRGGNGSTNPFWSVDLTGRYNIGQIMVYNRQDCCSDRLAGFKVIIWDGIVEAWTYTHAGGTPPYLNVIHVPGKYGSRVEVTIPGGGKILHLAEVEIFPPELLSTPSLAPTLSEENDPDKFSFSFFHNGHCASGWMDDNRNVDTVDECATICGEREGCGYFAYDASMSYDTNCATYFDSDDCLDDNLYPQFNSYKIGPSYSFSHDGHCASGWMGNNRNVETVDECAIICGEREGCGYFAYGDSISSITNCATYFESDGCPDDNLFPEYKAYELVLL